jgi:hypothetical protein
MIPHIENSKRMHSYRIQNGFAVTPTIGATQGVPLLFPKLANLQTLRNLRMGIRGCQKFE